MPERVILPHDAARVGEPGLVLQPGLGLGEGLPTLAGEGTVIPPADVIHGLADVVVGEAVGAKPGLAAVKLLFLGADARAGLADDERDVGGLGRGERDDPAALAGAEESDAAGVDAGRVLEGADEGQG